MIIKPDTLYWCENASELFVFLSWAKEQGFTMWGNEIDVKKDCWDFWGTILLNRGIRFCLENGDIRMTKSFEPSTSFNIEAFTKQYCTDSEQNMSALIEYLYDHEQRTFMVDGRKIDKFFAMAACKARFKHGYKYVLVSNKRLFVSKFAYPFLEVENFIPLCAMLDNGDVVVYNGERYGVLKYSHNYMCFIDAHSISAATDIPVNELKKVEITEEQKFRIPFETRYFSKNGILYYVENIYDCFFIAKMAFNANNKIIVFCDEQDDIVWEHDEHTLDRREIWYCADENKYRIVSRELINFVILNDDEYNDYVLPKADFFANYKKVTNESDYSCVVSAERLDEMTAEVINVFKAHGYKNATELGVGKFLENWNKKKAKLASILRKHPDWDEDNLCVKTKGKVKREISESVVMKHLDSFVGKYYADTSIARERVLNGSFFKWSCMDGKCSGTFVRLCKNYGLEVKQGTKPTRAVMQIIKQVPPLKNTEDLDKDLAILCDAISSKTQDVNYCLSINPIDFLLMSNGVSWSSCQYLEFGNDDKCYQAGTMSYPNDKVTMIFYTTLEDNKAGICYEPKLNRQLFMYDGNALLQSRLYPNHADEKLNADFLIYVKHVLNECEDNGVWNTYYDCPPNDVLENYFTTNGEALHYRDYEYLDYHCSLSIREKCKLLNSIIGGETFCPCCGRIVDEEDSCYCYDCICEANLNYEN